MAGGDVTREVKTRFVAEDAGYSAHLQNLANLGMLASLQIAGIQAAGQGISGVVQGLLGLQSHLEDTRMAIAGTMSAYGLAGEPLAAMEARLARVGNEQDRTAERAASMARNMHDASLATRQVLGTIDTLAAALPGETADYVTVFQQGLAGMRMSGMTALTGPAHGMAEFASRFAAVALSVGHMAAEEAAGNFTELLSGRAGVRVGMWQALMPFIHATETSTRAMRAEEFNRLSAVQRREAIERALVAYQPMMNAMAETWSSQWGTTESLVKRILTEGTAPLFESLKRGLGIFNTWLDRHRQTLTDIVLVFSTGLHDAFDFVVGAGERFATLLRYAAQAAHAVGGYLRAALEYVVASPAFGALLVLANRLYAGAQGLLAFGGGGGAHAGAAGGAAHAPATLHEQARLFGERAHEAWRNRAVLAAQAGAHLEAGRVGLVNRAVGYADDHLPTVLGLRASTLARYEMNQINPGFRASEAHQWAWVPSLAVAAAGLLRVFGGIGVIGGVIVGSLGQFATHTHALGEFLKALGAGVGEVVAIFAMGARLLTGVEIAIGDVLAGLLPGFMRGIDAFLGGVAGAMALVSPQILELLDQLEPFFTGLGEALGAVAEQAGGALAAALIALAGAAASLLAGLNGLVRFIREHAALFGLNASEMPTQAGNLAADREYLEGQASIAENIRIGNAAGLMSEQMQVQLVRELRERNLAERDRNDPQGAARAQAQAFAQAFAADRHLTYDAVGRMSADALRAAGVNEEGVRLLLRTRPGAADNQAPTASAREALTQAAHGLHELQTRLRQTQSAAIDAARGEYQVAVQHEQALRAGHARRADLVAAHAATQQTHDRLRAHLAQLRTDAQQQLQAQTAQVAAAHEALVADSAAHPANALMNRVADTVAGLGGGIEDFNQRVIQPWIHPRGADELNYQGPPGSISPPATPGARGGHVTNFINNRWDVTQRFEEGFDPDRIITAMTRDVERLSDRRLASGFESALGVAG